MTQPVLRSPSKNTTLAAIPVCKAHKIVYCGVCAEEHGMTRTQIQHLYHYAHCGVCPGDEELPIEEREKLWQNFQGEKTAEMQQAYEAMMEKVGQEKEAKMEIRRMANCGECEEEEEAACDELDMSDEKKKLKKKKMECDDMGNMKKRKKKVDEEAPEVMECGEIMGQRRQTLTKLARFARLRNDEGALKQLREIHQLLK